MKLTDITPAKIDAAAKVLSESRTREQVLSLMETTSKSEEAKDYVFVALSSTKLQYSSAQQREITACLFSIMSIGIEIGRNLE